MRHPLLESAFVLAVLSFWTHSAVAQAECSTEKVNGSCTVYIDRRYPVTSPTIQMRRGQQARVAVLNALPFEKLSLDPLTAQGLAGTDQTANSISGASPYFKALVIRQSSLVGTKQTPSWSDSIKFVMAHAMDVYLQLQEILSPIPRPREAPPDTAWHRDPDVMALKTPDPWTEPTKWRRHLLCELAGGPECGTATFSNLLGHAQVLQAFLFDTLTPSAVEPPGASDYKGVIKDIVSDLGKYQLNIEALTMADTGERVLGEIYDPRSSKGACSNRWLACQVSFSVNALNQIGTPAASVPAASAMKSIVTVTVLYAEPRLEFSAGVLLSWWLPNRSFANQTAVTNSPGSSPVAGNVVLTQTKAYPTAVPFVALNYKLGHDFTWLGDRRGAIYGTVLAGLNPNNSTTEFGAGFSVSWRLVMLSALLHVGHDISLTQGEYANEIWCNQTAASTDGTIAKCLSTPPSPSTQKFWKGTFALGLSVRAPTVFGGGAAAGGGH
jgi:hypothetical protein